MYNETMIKDSAKTIVLNAFFMNYNQFPEFFPFPNSYIKKPTKKL